MYRRSYVARCVFLSTADGFARDDPTRRRMSPFATLFHGQATCPPGKCVWRSLQGQTPEPCSNPHCCCAAVAFYVNSAELPPRPPESVMTTPSSGSHYVTSYLWSKEIDDILTSVALLGEVMTPEAREACMKACVEAALGTSSVIKVRRVATCDSREVIAGDAVPETTNVFCRMLFLGQDYARLANLVATPEGLPIAVDANTSFLALYFLLKSPRGARLNPADVRRLFDTVLQKRQDSGVSLKPLVVSGREIVGAFLIAVEQIVQYPNSPDACKLLEMFVDTFLSPGVANPRMRALIACILHTFETLFVSERIESPWHAYKRVAFAKKLASHNASETAGEVPWAQLVRQWSDAAMGMAMHCLYHDLQDVKSEIVLENSVRCALAHAAELFDQSKQPPNPTAPDTSAAVLLSSAADIVQRVLDSEAMSTNPSLLGIDLLRPNRSAEFEFCVLLPRAAQNRSMHKTILTILDRVVKDIFILHVTYKKAYHRTPDSLIDAIIEMCSFLNKRTVSSTLPSDEATGVSDFFEGGPLKFLHTIIEFGELSLTHLRRLWEGTKTVSDANPTSSSVNADSGSNDTIMIPQHLEYTVALILEGTVSAACGAREKGSDDPCVRILGNEAVSRYALHRIPIPDMEDNYRRKLFLHVNLNPGGELEDAHDKECSRLLASIPHLLLQWPAISILAKLINDSTGQNQRYLKVVEAAIARTLPTSTTRTKLASTFNLLRLIVRQERAGKIAPIDALQLIAKCCAFLVMSYAMESWWRIVTVMCLLCLIVLNLTGQSRESWYIADEIRLRRFCDLDRTSDLGKAGLDRDLQRIIEDDQSKGVVVIGTLPESARGIVRLTNGKHVLAKDHKLTVGLSVAAIAQGPIYVEPVLSENASIYVTRLAEMFRRVSNEHRLLRLTYLDINTESTALNLVRSSLAHRDHPMKMIASKLLAVFPVTTSQYHLPRPTIIITLPDAIAPTLTFFEDLRAKLGNEALVVVVASHQQLLRVASYPYLVTPHAVTLTDLAQGRVPYYVHRPQLENSNPVRDNIQRLVSKGALRYDTTTHEYIVNTEQELAWLPHVGEVISSPITDRSHPRVRPVTRLDDSTTHHHPNIIHYYIGLILSLISSIVPR